MAASCTDQSNMPSNDLLLCRAFSTMVHHDACNRASASSWYYQWLIDVHPGHAEGGIRPLAPGRAAAKVALVNTVPFHTEVYTALLYSFVRAGAEVRAFVDTKATAGMEHVIESWCAPGLPPAAFSGLHVPASAHVSPSWGDAWPLAACMPTGSQQPRGSLL